MLPRNLILDTDSYKASHADLYPPGATSMFSYFESRGGRWGSTLFFGLQYLLKEYLSQPISRADVEEASAFFAAHGEPFNVAGWMRIVDHHGGRLPIRVRAAKEGLVVPTKNALMTVESTDPETFWIVSWLETQLVRLWYPITVATQSWHIKKTILEYLQDTADDPASEIDFKLHDFGGRGVSSRESAGIGGMAHLVNFKGSDTVEGVRFANHYYGTAGGMSAYSIPAAEHSTVTMWGRERELDAYRHLVQRFCKPGALVACVSDSYNFWNVIENVWGDALRDDVINSGATLVIRPDSGDPPKVVVQALRALERKVGCRKNLRGFKVLPKSFRLIQGDGINDESIADILHTMKIHDYSASNIAFGMGGALLQKLDRDTQKFAFKCSHATVDGRPIDVYKSPVDDSGKVSKAGRLDLILQDGKFSTVRIDGAPRANTQMATVFEDGRLLRETTLDEVRALAMKSLV